MTEQELSDLLSRSHCRVVGDPLQKVIRKHGFASSPAASKYGNKKVVVNGQTFDSKGEFQRWNELLMMQSAGKISDLKRQVVFELAPSVTIGGRKRPPMKYTADFTYTEDGQIVVEDFKNPATAAECSFRMRQHLMKHVHGIEVKVTVRKVGRK